MNGAFYIGATGLSAQERGLAVTANNITNLNTPGYKRAAISFSELVATQRPSFEAMLANTGRSSILSGVAADASARIFAQGELRLTDSDLDIAIDGEGFIELLGQNGETMLWRGGTLTVNEDGYLAAANGMPLRGLITVPVGTTDLTIDRNGMIRAIVDGAPEPEEIGQIELAMVQDSANMTSAGNAMFRPASDSGVAVMMPGEDGAGSIVQGAIENSNVDLASEVVTLLLLQRGFAASSQVVRAGDQLMAIANDLRR
ncbi:MAG: flagellar hook-basal body protein [Pseudomonadota bacterium]